MLNTRESAIGTPWMSHTLNNHNDDTSKNRKLDAKLADMTIGVNFTQ